MKIILSLVGLIIILSVGYGIDQNNWKDEVGNYSGDGEISILETGLLLKGYQISFDSFSINEPYKASYQLKDLPNLKKSLALSLSASRSLTEFTDDDLLNGSSLTLNVNDNNKRIVSISEKLSKWNKTSDVDSSETRLYFMASGKSSIIDYEDYKGADLLVDIIYTPPENMNKQQSDSAKLIVRVGGHK